MKREGHSTSRVGAVLWTELIALRRDLASVDSFELRIGQRPRGRSPASR